MLRSSYTSVSSGRFQARGTRDLELMMVQEENIAAFKVPASYLCQNMALTVLYALKSGLDCLM